MTSATYDALNRQMFIMESVSPDWRMHKVDVQTGKILETASNGMGVPPVGHGLQQVLLHCRCPQNFRHLRPLLYAG